MLELKNIKDLGKKAILNQANDFIQKKIDNGNEESGIKAFGKKTLLNLTKNVIEEEQTNSKQISTHVNNETIVEANSLNKIHQDQNIHTSSFNEPLSSNSLEKKSENVKSETIDTVQLDNEYNQLSEKAHFDLTYESDFQAALRAPAAFLLNVTSFEQTFDRILFHLDEAIRKADDLAIKRSISRVADDLFNKQIFIIQLHIERLKSENSKGFFQKLNENIKKITDGIANAFSNPIQINPAAKIALSIAPGIGNLMSSYITYLNEKMSIERNEATFYNQVASVYQKILNSDCFSNEFGLLRNTFSRNKEDIIRFVVYNKGITAAKNLMKFDVNESEKQDSVRIISIALVELRNWDNVISFLHEIKVKQYENYDDIENIAIIQYKEFLKSKIFGLNVFRSNLRKIEKKIFDQYLEDFINQLKGNYEEYVQRIKKDKLKKKLILFSCIFTPLIIILILNIINIVGYEVILGYLIISFCIGIYALPLLVIYNRKKNKIIQKITS